MSQNVIQFSCSTCQAVLTVPVHMAGVTGPCPKCGATVTSPSAPPATPAVPAFSVPSIPEPTPPPAPAPVYQPPAQATPPPPPQVNWPPPVVAAQSSIPSQGWGSPASAVSEPDISPPASLGDFGSTKAIPATSTQIGSLLSPGVATSSVSGTTLPAKRLPESPKASGSLLRQVTSGTSGVMGSPRQNPIPSGPLSSPSQPSLSAGLTPPTKEESPPDDPMAAFLRGTSANGQGNTRTEDQPSIDGNPSPFPTHIKVQLGGEKKKSGKFIPFFFLILLLGGLGYAGWRFSEPIKKFALPFFSSNSNAPQPLDPTPPAKPESGGMAFNPEETKPPVAPPVDNLPVQPTNPAPSVNSPDPQPPSKPSDRIIEVKPALPTGTEEPPTKTSQSRPPPPPEIVIKADPQSEGAAKALVSFFAAENQTERLEFTLGASSVAPLMSRYYEKETDGPVQVNEITLLRFDQTPETGGGAHCVFTVASKLWEFPIPVMLQEEGGKFKVDWLAFVEFRDNLLYKFLSQYQNEPVRFHVGIRRTHYFADDVPDLSGKDCFEIQPPLPTYVGYVFVPKKSALANDLDTKISWETSKAYVIVELRWKKEGDKKWVELLAVPQLNWYSFQLGPKPTPPPPPKAQPIGN